jgi:hypothetical protein
LDRPRVNDVADAVKGTRGHPQRNDWLDAECAAATYLKNGAYKNMLAKRNTRRAKEQYQRRYEEKKIHRRKKREAWKGMMEEIEEAGTKKEIRKFYRKVNTITKGYKPRTQMCNHVTGKQKEPL